MTVTASELCVGGQRALRGRPRGRAASWWVVGHFVEGLFCPPAGGASAPLYRRYPLEFLSPAAALQVAEGEANAMTLATATPDGLPAARVVLLKGVEDGPEGGFLFFTNYGSDKGRAMAANPAVALVFFWHALERQVRVEGRVEKVSRAESEAYFAKRPRGSQLGAVASPQSAPVASRAVLEARLAEAEARFAGAEVACPEDWGGYRVVPSRVEFWQGRESRLHDRIVYARSATGWSLSRLGP